MNERWQGWLEMISVLAVVGGLLIVAFELRQANRIARAQAVMDLSAAHNVLNSTRFANTDFARLSIDDLANYRNDLTVVLQEMPGLIPDLLYIYETQVGKRDAYVFEPLAELAEERREEAPSE